ncbi:MAG: hypothetical protein LPK00_10380 [Bacillaceae bacterium]|nr:hypothetical protein [Bacillaceae bacterium]
MWNISKEAKEAFLTKNLLPVHETDERMGNSSNQSRIRRLTPHFPLWKIKYV